MMAEGKHFKRVPEEQIGSTASWANGDDFNRLNDNQLKVGGAQESSLPDSTSNFASQADLGDSQLYDSESGGLEPLGYLPVLEGAKDITCPQSGKRKLHRKCALIALFIVMALLCFIGASGFMLYRSARSVQGKAQNVISLATGVASSLSTGDYVTFAENARELDGICSDIRAEVDGPLWQVASLLPVVGGDVQAARTLVVSVDDVSSAVLVPMAENLSSSAQGKLFQDGAINVSAATTLMGSLADGSEAISSVNEQVQSIGDTNISQVSSLVDTAKRGFTALSSAADIAQAVDPVLAQMLGADGQVRNYIITAVNNVELRANGGLGAHNGLLSVTDGAMSMGEFMGSINLPEDQQLPVTDEEQNLFNKLMGHMGMYNAEAMLTPDFPRAASLTAQMWETLYGQHVDGVISIDPVFLQYLLGAVGGTTLSNGVVLNGTNAATVLMHDVYWDYPQPETDAIFEEAAGAAFDAVMSGMGNADMVQLASAFMRGASEGRICVWMAGEDEQKAVETMGVSAALPAADDVAAAPQAGVYLNNMSFSKMDWYLDFDVQVSDGVKNSDGSTSYDVTVNLKNTCTEAEEAQLPDYVGCHLIKEDGSIEFCGLERYIVYLYAPQGGDITDMEVSGDGGMRMNDGTHNGLEVKYGMIDLYPQDASTITYTVTTSPEAVGELQMRATPTCQEVRENG
ncbi:DUF4012 domain-containing protein [Collinsella ihumii]|uniref:DUF4012 domain-containing protein n=1 Tax=Collinsella ihumii TaxID=1720204 RepID=A0AAW7JPS0_9ACTN|nr:DUF4012 domain-containing protein [Collinsella ihumii]MDN0069553.1 DUF4012 domain-containing protein [Collinsella ihumii]